MPLNQIKNTLSTFLQAQEAAVVVLKGKWGIGKTHFWKSFVKAKASELKLGTPHYSYVSLFGLKNLEELQAAIFVNRKNIGVEDYTINQEPWKTETRNIFGKAKELFKQVPSTPFIQNFTGSLSTTITFMSVRDTLICLDDYERKNADLNATEILGLVSLLKEQRNCNIVLILNDSALENSERDLFRKDLEKVVDVEVAFLQSAENAFSTQFVASHQYFGLVRELVIALNIDNIRIIRKIKRNIERLEAELAQSNEEVETSLITSIVLFTWAHNDQEGLAPSLQFILDYGTDLFSFYKSAVDPFSDSEAETDPTEPWREMLRAVNYMATDDTDRAIAKYVTSGIFSPEEFTRLIEIKNGINNQDQARRDYADVWSIYRRSFADDADEFIRKLILVFRENIKLSDAGNLQSTVSILRKLGEDDTANELIHEYINCHIDSPSAFNISRLFQKEEPLDTYMLEQFEAAKSKLSEAPTLLEVLSRVAEADSWGAKDELFLANASANEYYVLFKTEGLDDLPRLVRRCLQFGKYINASEQSLKISNSAKEALLRIASENPLNRLRVMTLYELEE